jgi:hypothetical protein
VRPIFTPDYWWDKDSWWLVVATVLVFIVLAAVLQ